MNLKELALIAHNKFPEASNTALANILCHQHPMEFSTLEQARSTVRFLRGRDGSSRRHLGAVRRSPKSRAHVSTPYNIPIPATILVLPDVHIDYHDEDALRIAVEYGKQQECDTVLGNGDQIDADALSTHDHDSDEDTFENQVYALNTYLGWLRTEFPDAKIVYKKGNHEKRLERYIMRHAPALKNLPELSWEGLLYLDDYEIDLVADDRIIWAGKLPIMHGHEWQGGSSVHPAKRAFMKAKGAVLVSHSHRTDQFIQQPLGRDKSVIAYATGCLCGQTPKWNPHNDWNLGFAIVRVDKNGDYEVDNLRIENGKVK